MNGHERVHAARRFDCPLAWCSGDWENHGGDGAPPEVWGHDCAHDIELPHGARLTRFREGTGPDVWTLMGGSVSYTHLRAHET